MDAMHAALKAKRSGAKAGLLHEQIEAPEMEQKEEQGVDLKGLVASLSEEQKAELMEMLSGEEGETSAVDIEKGEASSEGKQALAAKVAKDDAEEPSDETDEAMLDGDRVVMGKVAKGIQPKGLGERAKMAAVERMKSKGKV